MKVKDNSIVYPLPTDEIIEKFEGLWRLKLPDGYINFIKAYNGARPAEYCFDGTRNGHENIYVVERFLCILEDFEEHPHGWYDIDVVLAQIGERLTTNGDLLGEDVLPIAELFAGDVLCLDFRVDKVKPTVCVWNHEESGVLDPVMSHVADSFEDFLNMLYLPDF